MSAFGYMYATNREIALREIEDVLERCEGNVSRAAHELGVTRTYFYKILWRDGDTLLPIIDRIRTAALARIAARRRMLTGEPNGPR